jgi:hypothetical protein
MCNRALRPARRAWRPQSPSADRHICRATSERAATVSWWKEREGPRRTRRNRRMRRVRPERPPEGESLRSAPLRSTQANPSSRRRLGGISGGASGCDRGARPRRRCQAAVHRPCFNEASTNSRCRSAKSGTPDASDPMRCSTRSAGFPAVGASRRNASSAIRTTSEGRRPRRRDVRRSVRPRGVGRRTVI